MASMNEPSFYPLFLSLENFCCLIIGFGKVGRRKMRAILPCLPKKIVIIDREAKQIFSKNSDNILSETSICLENRAWNETDIQNSDLVFACTNDAQENIKICQLCRKNKKLCNSATTPEQGNFMVPAIAREDNLTIAFSTAGKSPLMAAFLKRQFSSFLQRHKKLVDFMGQIRPFVLNEGGSSDYHKSLLEKMTNSPFPELLMKKNYEECRRWINMNFPEQLAKKMNGILGEMEK